MQTARRVTYLLSIFMMLSALAVNQFVEEPQPEKTVAAADVQTPQTNVNLIMTSAPSENAGY